MSCDLAHTYKITHGPDIGKEPYGVKKEAELFDNLIKTWISDPIGP